MLVQPASIEELSLEAERFVQEVSRVTTESGQVCDVLPGPGVGHLVVLEEQLPPGHLLPVPEGDVELHCGDSLQPLVGDVISDLVSQGATARAGGRELSDGLTLALTAQVGAHCQQCLTLRTI